MKERKKIVGFLFLFLLIILIKYQRSDVPPLLCRWLIQVHNHSPSIRKKKRFFFVIKDCTFSMLVLD